jgi:cell division protein FtsW
MTSVIASRLADLNPWNAVRPGLPADGALIVGRGEWVGVGLGRRVQKLFYLPAHTVFIHVMARNSASSAALLVPLCALVGRALMACAR